MRFVWFVLGLVLLTSCQKAEDASIGTSEPFKSTSKPDAIEALEEGKFVGEIPILTFAFDFANPSSDPRPEGIFKALLNTGTVDFVVQREFTQTAGPTPNSIFRQAATCGNDPACAGACNEDVVVKVGQYCQLFYGLAGIVGGVNSVVGTYQVHDLIRNKRTGTKLYEANINGRIVARNTLILELGSGEVQELTQNQLSRINFSDDVWRRVLSIRNRTSFVARVNAKLTGSTFVFDQSEKERNLTLQPFEIRQMNLTFAIPYAGEFQGNLLLKNNDNPVNTRLIDLVGKSASGFSRALVDLRVFLSGNRSRLPVQSRARLTALYSNPEPGTARNFTLTFYAISPSNQTTVLRQFDSVTLAGPGAGTFEINTSPLIQAGTWLFYAVVDSGNAVNETNELNNVSYLPVVVGSDLEITATSATPSVLSQSATVRFTARVKNKGEGFARYDLQYFVFPPGTSVDFSGTPSSVVRDLTLDQYLETEIPVDVLISGGEGEYRVGFQVVSSTDPVKANNTGVAVVNFVAPIPPPGPDLAFAQLQQSPVGPLQLPNATTTTSVTIRNQGTTTATYDLEIFKFLPGQTVNYNTVPIIAYRGRTLLGGQTVGYQSLSTTFQVAGLHTIAYRIVSAADSVLSNNKAVFNAQVNAAPAPPPPAASQLAVVPSQLRLSDFVPIASGARAATLRITNNGSAPIAGISLALNNSSNSYGFAIINTTCPPRSNGEPSNCHRFDLQTGGENAINAVLRLEDQNTILNDSFQVVRYSATGAVEVLATVRIVP